MNLSSTDLNLLVAFDALMIERHVTRAGQRVGLSQPAMSAALSRLRQLTKDELFTRQSDGMHPTARAEELVVPIRRALEDIKGALDAEQFDPSQSQRVFRIALNDFGASVILPPLVERLRREASGIDLRILPTNDDRAVDLLDRDHADIAVGSFQQVPAGRFEMAILFHSAFYCVVREGHELTRTSTVSLEAFASLPHLLFSQTGEATGFIDAVLAKEGLRRRVAVTVPHFLVAPFVLARSDLVATLPTRLVDDFGGMAGLTVVQAPIALPEFPCTLLWTSRAGSSAAHAWLRQQIVEVTTN